MRLKFGIGLDGSPFPPAKPLLGDAAVGEHGLVRILAQRLGFGGQLADTSIRQSQYRAALEAADDGQRFYSASFRVDPTATAATLLSWRDQWMIAGFRFPSSAKGKRVKDLCAVEAQARGRMGRGQADVTSDVVDALGAGQSPDVVVTCEDRRELLSPWIAAILDNLEATFNRVEVTPSAPEKTDLGRLQRSLLSGERFKIKQDDSVIVLESRLPAFAGRHLATFLPDSGSSVIIHGHADISPLAHAIAERGEPRIGSVATTATRPASQLLKLSLNLIWDPLDPVDLLQFLNHPIAPLPKRLREKLAGCVQSKPGVGSSEWNEIVSECEKEEKASDDLAFWIGHDRFSDAENVPIAAICERIRRLGLYLRGYSRMTDHRELKTSLEAAARLVSDAMGLFSQYPKDSGMSRAELDKWLSSISSRRESRETHATEIGSVPVSPVTSPLLGSVDTVIWWGFQDESLPKRLPWSGSEIAELESLGCILQKPEVETKSMTQTWLRHVMAARERIVFVRLQSQDESSRAHPLFDEILALTPAEGEAGSLLLRAPEREVLSEALRPERLRLHSIPRTDFPSAKRWWNLPEGVVVPRRETESFSSIDTMIHRPYAWVMDRVARIRAGRLSLGLSEKIIAGNVAHRVIEEFLTSDSWRNMSDAAIEAFVEKTIDRCFGQEGAVFLVRGMQRERESLRASLNLSLKTLRAQLLELPVAKVFPEAEQKADFEGAGLTGFVDILLQLEDGREAIIDVKSGWRSKRVSELRDNLHLQLATYGALRFAATGQWPKDVAYFLTSRAELLAQSTRFFTHASAQAPRREEPLAGVWNRILETWRWRRAQLDRGKIEFNVSFLEPERESQPPASSLSLQASYDEYCDYAFFAKCGGGG